MGKRPPRKKKRVSKHVLNANEKLKGNSEDALEHQKGVQSTHVESTQKQQPKKRKKPKTKDPIEAAAYLSAWKHRESGGGWKFNKNTQSWLIRHMYEVEKLDKVSFGIMLDYLTGLSQTAKSRIIQVAEKRARRYKEFEKTLVESHPEPSNREANPQKEDAGGTKARNMDETLESHGEDDESRWKRLDNHNKRKEYKRARKILEKLQ